MKNLVIQLPHPDSVESYSLIFTMMLSSIYFMGPFALIGIFGTILFNSWYGSNYPDSMCSGYQRLCIVSNLKLKQTSKKSK
jgi:hypothetical protein